MINDTRRPCWKMVGRRAGWLAAALLLALPGAASTLSLSANITTGSYIPGYFQLEDEIANAQSNSQLVFGRQEFAPDAFHTAFGEGVAMFGRLGATTRVSTSGPDIFGYSSDLLMLSDDTITIHGASSGFLSLDVSVHGVLSQNGPDGRTFGHFGIITESLDAEDIFTFADYCMAWFGANAPGFCNTSTVGELAPLLAATTIGSDGNGGAVYAGQATILIPFSVSSFILRLSLDAFADCAPTCSASSDLGHTALIGGVRILDSSMKVMPGAFLTSESGYDYVTPPAAATAGVPEPGTVVLVAGAIGFMMLRRGAKR